jgi:hypothetical protein
VDSRHGCRNFKSAALAAVFFFVGGAWIFGDFQHNT